MSIRWREVKPGRCFCKRIWVSGEVMNRGWVSIQHRETPSPSHVIITIEQDPGLRLTEVSFIRCHLSPKGDQVIHDSVFMNEAMIMYLCRVAVDIFKQFDIATIVPCELSCKNENGSKVRQASTEGLIAVIKRHGDEVGLKSRGSLPCTCLWRLSRLEPDR